MYIYIYIYEHKQKSNPYPLFVSKFFLPDKIFLWPKQQQFLIPHFEFESNNLSPKGSVSNFKTFPKMLVGYLLFFCLILNDATVSLSAEFRSTPSCDNSFFKT